MKLHIAPPARAEILEAMAYFDSKGRSVARHFAADLRQTLQSILDEPTAWPRMTRRSRKRNMYRFKYGVVYQIKESLIAIVAFVNLLRGPSYWRKRMRGL